MSNILITGGTGFIGQHLVNQLALQGHNIRVLAFEHEENKFIFPWVQFVYGNITDYNSLKNAMKGIDQVYHLAALADQWAPDLSKFYHVNRQGTYNVLSAAKEMNIKRVLHSSSAGLFGNTGEDIATEDSPYPEKFDFIYDDSKYQAELLVNDFLKEGLDIVTIYPSRVYGPGQFSVSNTTGFIINNFLNGKPSIIPGDGNRFATYVFITDVINGMINAMEKGTKGERYILGGVHATLNDIFHLLQELTGINNRKIYVPFDLIKTVARLMELRYKLFGIKPFIVKQVADRLHYHSRVSSQKSITELGYQITPLREGLKETIDSYRAKSDEYPTMLEGQEIRKRYVTTFNRRTA